MPALILAVVVALVAWVLIRTVTLKPTAAKTVKFALK